MKTASMVWAALGLCAVLVIGAMSWLTRSVVAAEHERSEAESRADLQERMRLALWRMDSAGAAFIVEEWQRLEARGQGRGGLVKICFEMQPGGGVAWTEPQEGAEELRKLLGRSVAAQDALTSVAIDRQGGGWGPAAEKLEASVEVVQTKGSSKEPEVQARANLKEYANRGRAVDNVIQRSQTYNLAEPPAGADLIEQLREQAPADDGGEVRPLWLEAGLPRAAWIGDELFLLRRLVGSHGVTVQGMWLDAVGLREMLLAEASDLLPGAVLAAANEASDDGMVLASFPWRLVGPASVAAGELAGTTVVSLAVGWLAALLALVAGALLVGGVMRLSERRASFVSAVTHELRTPLTTFKLYTDLLGNGVVREEQRGDYLRVLGREADRLSHLVENVLAFSRIERGSAKTTVRQTTVAELIEPLRERLESHLAEAGMALRLDLEEEAARMPVRADTAAVEHIIFNLVDNAGKYAAGSEPAEVGIRVAASGRQVAISVCDHGPGVAAGERRRIFRAFHKSARDAAESRPGVGLGLALSRRLARALGGDLVYQPGRAGACFVLRVPRVR